jgi:hypothetical protein
VKLLFVPVIGWHTYLRRVKIMANNFMSKERSSEIFKGMADKMNAEIQACLVETGKDNVEFTLGCYSFNVKREDKE